MSKPQIALTMGDPAGVGPELVLRALADPNVRDQCCLTVFCDSTVLHRCAAETGLTLAEYSTIEIDAFATGDTCADGHQIVDLHNVQTPDLIPGQVDSHCGQACYEYIQSAIDAVQAGHVDAVTTAPINKASLHAAGINYPGHTEMFAERDGSDRWCMMQYSEEITCSFVTVHVGYAQVPSLLSQQRIEDTIDLTAAALQRIRKRQPHLVVCGLNPHAGENGLFGNNEEQTMIQPAIDAARSRGISIEGPLPPDTAFVPWKRKETDGFVCMYHDQGHIPVKALAFDSAVNTTLGLDIVRTSVDHGTAYDIAWQGKARTGSLFSAIRLAALLSQHGT